jgi:hypothetical protein
MQPPQERFSRSQDPHQTCALWRTPADSVHRLAYLGT